MDQDIVKRVWPSLALTPGLGVVLIGARCFPAFVCPPVSYGIVPNNTDVGFGGQLLSAVLLIPPRFAEITASRPTDSVGGCGCTKEFVTSIRKGQGPCT